MGTCTIIATGNPAYGNIVRRCEPIEEAIPAARELHRDGWKDVRVYSESCVVNSGDLVLIYIAKN